MTELTDTTTLSFYDREGNLVLSRYVSVDVAQHGASGVIFHCPADMIAVVGEVES